VTEIDQLFEAVGFGHVKAFASWMGRVERPIRLSLRAYARAVDVEGIVQETLLRMWTLGNDGSRRLDGENASLRFAIGMARNLARNEARRLRREHLLPPDDMPDPGVPPEPTPDPGLARAIADCMKRLARKPLEALRARIEHQPHDPDRDIAARLGMTVNAFLQNIVRARRQLGDCLVRKGIPLEEMLR